MAQLYGYLFFEGNCREAMEFYKDCLGGKLDMMKMGDAPVAEHMEADKHDLVMHAALQSESLMLMASDWMTEEVFKVGNNVSLCLVCESKEELEDLFAKFIVGGQEVMPIKEEFFGTFGVLTDKFGVSWMFQFGSGEMK